MICIDTSWNHILEGNYHLMRSYTILMGIKLIIGLKTWRSWIGACILRNHMIGNKLSDTAKRKLRKLTVEQVIEIRKLKGNMSKRKVANIFNVGSATIQDIWCGKTWN